MKRLLLLTCLCLALGLTAAQKEKAKPAAGQAALPAGVEDLTFTAKNDRSEQKYAQILPEGFKADKETDLMIALHGHGSTRMQFIEQDRGECKGARDTAAKHGMIFVCPEYRGNSWMGPAAEEDLVQLIDELKKKYKIGRVFLVGGSMGGSSVLTFTALHPDLVDGVSSQNGLANHVDYTNFQDAIAKSFGGSRTEKPDEYKKRNAEFFPEKFTMPVAITAGGKDTAVPPDSVMRLAEQIKKTNKNVLVILRKDVGHSTSYEDTVAAAEFIIEKAVKAPAKKGPGKK